MRRFLLIAAASLLFTGRAFGQAPHPAAQAAVPQAALTADQALASTPAPDSPLPVDAYTYRPEGRRDPFSSLVGVGRETRAPGKPADGLSGFAIGEVSVRGIIQTSITMVAMVQGPDGKTYVVHQGDKFADSVVKSVTPQGLVVMQDITDPLSTQKQREVRKLLRSLEDAK